MHENIKNLINQSVTEIIQRSANDKKIASLIKKHDKKIHFIPARYRVFGGLLQSMNIQFGNFIEILMKNLIANKGKYEILEKYSGKKSNSFSLLKSNEELIDNYITFCQTHGDVELEKEFKGLLAEIFRYTNRIDDKFITFKLDIDLLFKNKQSGKIYYLEIKYNDDHDTGKFIKTYAYLLNEFKLKNYDDLVPILFFFNNKKLKGNIYVPENTNIKRGQKFFDEFLSTSYNEVDKYLTKLSQSQETLQNFNDLYKKILNI